MTTNEGVEVSIPYEIKIRIIFYICLYADMYIVRENKLVLVAKNLLIAKLILYHLEKECYLAMLKVVELRRLSNWPCHKERQRLYHQQTRRQRTYEECKENQ